MNSNKQPLVSICILCYNHEKYVARCIESCLNQTYQNIEIIIVDNASTDTSPKIIETYNDEHDNIQCLLLDINTFPSGGLNLLVKEANGEYLSIVAADDYFELNKTEVQLNYMLENNLTNSFTWINVVDDKSNHIINHSFEHLFNKSFTNTELQEHFIKNGNALCAPSVMLHKEIFNQYGLFDQRLMQLQDYEFWLRIIKKEPINILTEVLTNYCVRDDEKNLSLSQDISVKYRNDFEEQKIIQHILQFDTAILSKVTGTQCNDDNKFKILFEYYLKKHKSSYADGILQILFESLSPSFNFPSPQYKDFFDMYSHFDPTQLQEKNIQIKVLEEEVQEKVKEIRDVHHQLFETTSRLGHDLAYARSIVEQRDEQIQALQQHIQSMYWKNKVKRIIKRVIPNKILVHLGYTPYQPMHHKKEVFSYQYTVPEFTPEIQKELSSFEYTPLVSIIMPVYNVDPKWLKLAIRSIENQWYENWELCIADDKSTNQSIVEYLQNIDHHKIKVKFLDNNLNISGATNAALSMATGEYIALMDNDDEITPNALYEMIKAVNAYEADFIYSDEDFISTEGECSNPHFKPDFSPDLLLSHNYITHFTCFKKDLLTSVGEFNSRFDGAQDYDLFLRLTEKASKIHHVQKVLYHWRTLETSTSVNSDVKPEALQRGKRVLEETLQRRGVKATVEDANLHHYFRVNYIIEENPLISIIIPFKDKPELLDVCVNSILEKSTYSNYEIIGISNNSEDPETYELMSTLEKKDQRVSFHEYNVEFNYSDINNHAVNTYAKGEHIILLNNDIEVISPDWIESMLEHSQREEIGCVGAKLYYPNDTVQHAGIIVGLGGYAGHSHKMYPRDNPGYFNRLNVVQNVSAVTAACLMIKKSIYTELNGLDHVNFKVAYNDVDFCLRVLESGYRNIYTPYTEMYHHESITRGYENTDEKQARFHEEKRLLGNRHRNILTHGDPYYNPNLTLDKEDFSICRN